MSIYKILDLDINKIQILSFVGGGGKTTTIFELAKEFIELNKKVLISTTTAIFTPSVEEYDYFFLEDIDRQFVPANGTISILSKEIIDCKLKGISLEKIDEIFMRNIFDIILVEADGAKGRPIKAPENHEPVVPKTSNKTIGVIGLDSLGKAINEDTVHRPQLLCEITGKKLFDAIDEEVIVKLVLDKNGLFKGSYGDKVLLLNKANNITKISRATKIRNILDCNGFESVIIGDIINKKFY